MAPKKDAKGAAGKDKAGKGAKSGDSSEKGNFCSAERESYRINLGHDDNCFNDSQVPLLEKRKKVAIQSKCATFCAKSKVKSWRLWRS